MLSHHNNQSGFTLLEAVVALVIISVSGMAIFEWLNSTLSNVEKVQQNQQQNQAIRNALAYMETVNPMLETSGKEELQPYLLSWKATLLEPIKEGSLRFGGKGLYDFGLYQVDLEITDNNQLVTEITLRKTGYKQARTPADGVFNE